MATCLQPFDAQMKRLCGIPGVHLLTAWTLIAELGIDVIVFPDPAHAVSWAGGLCPGNRESAGERLSSRTKRQSLDAAQIVSIGLGGDTQARLSFDLVLTTERSLGYSENVCGSRASMRNRLQNTSGYEAGVLEGGRMIVRFFI